MSLVDVSKDASDTEYVFRDIPIVYPRTVLYFVCGLTFLVGMVVITGVALD